MSEKSPYYLTPRCPICGANPVVGLRTDPDNFGRWPWSAHCGDFPSHLCAIGETANDALQDFADTWASREIARLKAELALATAPSP